MDQAFTIQWYPGHMAKARRLLVTQIKQVDFVIEVADARAPASTRNPAIDEFIQQRPRLLVLSKEDLADPEALSRWVKHLRAGGLEVVTASFVDPGSVNRAKSSILKWIHRSRTVHRFGQIGAPDVAGLRLPRSGAVRRGLVAGIPNTGKSTLIRAMGGRGVAVGAKAGVTRGIQWINAGPGVQLLDSPGLLWPRAESGGTALTLAWLGAVGDGAYDAVDAALGLVRWLLADRPGVFRERYNLTQDDREPERVLEHIATERGLLLRGGEPDVTQAAQALLWDLRRGRLGRVMFDAPPAG